MFENDDEVT